MKAGKDNRTLYQNTFDEVHASEDLLRKVEAMKHEHGTFKKTLSKGAITAAAFALLVFSNVISYAASGNAWILTITLPDGETRQIELEPGSEDDQTFVHDHEGASESVSSEATAAAEEDVMLEASDDDMTWAHRLETVNDRIYLVLDEQHRLDITDQFQDGVCKGTFDADDVTWCYEITGTTEDYDIQVYAVTYHVK